MYFLTRNLANESSFIRSIAVPRAPSVTTIRIHGDTHSHFLVITIVNPKTTWGTTNGFERFGGWKQVIPRKTKFEVNAQYTLQTEVHKSLEFPIENKIQSVQNKTLSTSYHFVRLGGFPMEIETEIRNFIISCYHISTLFRF